MSDTDLAKKIEPTKKALVLSGGGARGAYQAGVYRYLEEIGFFPDVICGTSVGALNAVALGSGMRSDRLIELWKNIDKNEVLSISWWKAVTNFFKKEQGPLADPEPLRRLIQREIPIDQLKNSPIETIITAVNIQTAELKLFGNKEIQVEHVLGSSAIPLFFPWQVIDGEYYWDGGIMANTPVLPALESDPDEMVIVLLSPVGNQRLGIPQNRKEMIERLFELSLLGSYRNLERDFDFRKDLKSKNMWQHILERFALKKKDFHVRVIAPKQFLGLGSILNFEKAQAERLLEEGYRDAKEEFTSPE
jgi:NTE family protein